MEIAFASPHNTSRTTKKCMRREGLARFGNACKGRKKTLLIQFKLWFATTWTPNSPAHELGLVHLRSQRIYSEGFSERSGVRRMVSGNIRLNTSPLILSGSSFGESFGWVSSF